MEQPAPQGAGTDMPEPGGRVFFSNVRRSLEFEDEIILVSVGVDIGSSTTHLVFSQLRLERLDNRYIVSERRILHESDVLLTPYADNNTIDAKALGDFIEAQYANAGVAKDTIDTGALILTGVAVRRANARAIGELFAEQAGKFVSVSAGDALETTLAAFGSGAAALSIRESQRVMNIDIGGGTSKIAVLEAGAVVEQTALDIGARIVSFDEQGRLLRVEEAGHRFAAQLGLKLVIGEVLSVSDQKRMAVLMAQRLLEAMQCKQLTPETESLLRLEPLQNETPPDAVTFSGGVSEFVYGRQQQSYGDLGQWLAQAVQEQLRQWSPKLVTPDQGIRATVVGASQYTVQVSGSTIYVEPATLLPLRNVPVIAPQLDLSKEELDSEAISLAIAQALRRLDLHEGEQSVALFYRWAGSATFARLDALCRGMAKGMQAVLAKGHPLILVGEADCGGLLGIHCHEEAKLKSPVISIDGITLSELDFIDIGALLETSGAVPVVIKSLVFPTGTGLGRSHHAVSKHPAV